MPLHVKPLPQKNAARGTPARIAIQLPRGDTAHLELFDDRGRLVADRPPEFLAGGAHEIAWPLPVLEAGTYFIRLSTGSGLSARQAWNLVP